MLNWRHFKVDVTLKIKYFMEYWKAVLEADEVQSEIAVYNFGILSCNLPIYTSRLIPLLHYLTGLKYRLNTYIHTCIWTPWFKWQSKQWYINVGKKVASTVFQILTWNQSLFMKIVIFLCFNILLWKSQQNVILLDVYSNLKNYAHNKHLNIDV